MNLAADPSPENGARSPTLTPEYWEDVFAEEDPWDYGNSTYERWKFDRTLSLLPARRMARAIELGCAEGHLTTRLAPLVGGLIAIDISPTAIARARRRCAGLANVHCQVLNIATDPLPAQCDLILCSEVLFYLPPPVLHEVAAKIAASLKPGGHLLLAHGNQISDDRTRTGFDWGHPFGAKTIGEAFAALPSLDLLKELRTPLYTVQLFRRATGTGKRKPKPEFAEIPLPTELVLSSEVERTVLWDGAETTRAEACAREIASEIPILMYHSVADDGPQELAPYRISPHAFREQLRYLRRHGYYSTTVAEWAACIAARRPLPGRPVILTFDDGYKDFIENAWPLLERADFKATLFVVTEKVGGVADWDPAVSQPLPLMSWEDLQELQAKGVEIGSHSASHKDFSAVPADAVMAEGQRALAQLHQRLGREATLIAFPWGRGDVAARRVLAQCGYRVGLTTWGGRSTLADDPMCLPRIEIFGDDDLAAFSGKLDRRAEAPGADAPQREAPVDAAAPSVGFDDARPVEPADSRSSLHSAIAAGAEIVGFDAPPVTGIERPIHPDYARALGARLDALIGEFVKLQTQLVNNLHAPVSLQKRLTMLFAQPVTGKVSRAAVPDERVSPEITLSFAEEARTILTIEPKADHSLSPETYLNTVGLALSGSSEWLELRVTMDWSDLSLAERFQLCLYARPNRSVSCSAVLRLPRKSGDLLDLDFASFELHPDEPNAVLSGELRMPDFIELDTRAKPTLLLSFGTETELSVVLHYFNVYFA